MRRIGIISDTHGFLDEAVFRHFKDCDEIWHAGDIGDMAIAERLAAFLPLRCVWGNIDGMQIRHAFPEVHSFTVEALNVFMIHIGGYPGRYAPGVAAQIKTQKAGLFISGHSHILKIMPDGKLNCLHINPGAAGRHGWHTVRTLVRISIEAAAIISCEVVELGKRGT